jgi:DNA-binding helix-hairpin-helix protein with protein kinase domain
MSLRLADEQGRPLALGPKLGEGGEGAVYQLAGQASLAVKVYAAPLTPEREHKIRLLAQLKQPDIARFAAWPTGIARDEKGKARGLLLPAVNGGRDVHQLYTPSSRRQHFPTATWRFLVHVCGNVARAFGAVHALGLVIGDVNPGSILVLGDGTVRLIDVDSFQVPVPGGRPLLCTVAVPLFLPPELHQAPLDSVVRTPDHDNFGLAITIFQLLMLGRHPYAGRYLGGGEMPIERAIVEHRFAYGVNAAGRNMQRPPNTVGMDILPTSVATLFESAFAPRAGGLARPTAGDWVQALDQVATALAQCPRDPAHYHPRTSAVCPWCGIEQQTGVILFSITAAAPQQAPTGDYEKLMTLIAAMPLPQPVPPPQIGGAVQAAPAAQAAGKVSLAALGGILAGLLLVVGGFALLLRGGLLLVLLGIFVGGIGPVVVRQRRRRWVTAYRGALTEYRRAAGDLDRANTFPAQAQIRAAVATVAQAWAGLPRRREEKRRQLEANKRRLQLDHFLQQKRIESATIKGIGMARVAMLSAYGVDTAADIVGAHISRVPQFGTVLTERLVDWRRSLERAFVFDPSRPPPTEAIVRIDREIENERRQLIERLRVAGRDLRTASAHERMTAEKAAWHLGAAAVALRQAEVDVTAATGKVPR